MTIAVRYSKAGGNTIVKITVDASMMHWTYKFAQAESANDSTFRGNSEDGLGSVRQHSLGFPNDLSGEIDSWEFLLANITKKQQPYSIKIEWIQDEKILVQTWEIAGKVEPNGTEPLGGNAMLIGA
jgi:hypothetical protein